MFTVDRLECKCPACDSNVFERLVQFDEIPLFGRFRTDTTSPLPTANLSHELCANCGLVRQWPVTHYTDYLKAGRPTFRQLPLYVDSLLDGIQAASPVGKSHCSILEVGCNDGTFMSALRDRGFTKLLGIEPSSALGSHVAARGFNIIVDYFGPAVVNRLREQGHSFDFIVCRHTLEHLPDPREFVLAARSMLADDGKLVLEVPDGDAIPDLMNIYEFWQEHLFIFSVPSLTSLLGRAGFSIERVDVMSHLETRNIVVWAQAALPFVPPITGNERGTVLRWKNFTDTWPKYRDQLLAVVNEAPRPLYMIGASHPQCNFANYLGIGHLVDFMVDDDPDKLGLFAPMREGAPTVIDSTAFLQHASGGSLLRTGFGYREWMDRLSERARGCGMRIIDPNDYKGV